MQKLIALTALFIAGRWLTPGATVPGDVHGYDYARAYQKGMLEAEDGSEVVNPETEPEAAPAPLQTDSAGGEALRTPAAQLTRERDEALVQLKDAQTDLAELAEYREVLGELLPQDFPARKVLFENGYYTLAMLGGVDKAGLEELEGIGTVLADKVLAALPAEPQEE